MSDMVEEEVKKLFAVYDEADRRVREAEAAVKAALAARSEAVKSLYDRVGKGARFLYKGKEVLVMKRGDTYFLRGNTDKQVESID